MKKVNELVLCSDDYTDENEFRCKIAEAIMLLTGAGYICVVREDEIGIIAIEYDRADHTYGTPYPYWLTPEDVDKVWPFIDTDEIEDGMIEPLRGTETGEF